jgi:hypothetical protein
MNSNCSCRKESKKEKSAPSAGLSSNLHDMYFITMIIIIIIFTPKEGAISCVQNSTSVLLQQNSKPM